MEVESKLFYDLIANTQCQDCDSCNPSWCSMSFGILICLACAGKHRSLGVHITMVKSLTLDEWDDRQIKYLKFGGNQLFRNYMQEHLKDQNFKFFEDKYKNKDAIYYRELLESKVNEREPKLSSDISFLEFQEKLCNSPNLISKQDQVLWILDVNAFQCAICGIHFTFFQRKHHCRRCGQVVCKLCAPKQNTRPIIEWGLKEPVRHCKICYKSPSVKWI